MAPTMPSARLAQSQHFPKCPLRRFRNRRNHRRPKLTFRESEKLIIYLFKYASRPLSSAEAPLRKGSAGVKFRGRRRREPLPETTPNKAAIRGSHFVTRVVCVLMS